MYNVANALTILRIVLLPLLYIFIKGHHVFPTSVVLILIIITDVLDGYYARKFHTQGVIGKVLDHGVDKIVSVFLSFMLYYFYNLPLWAFYFFVIRDLLILFVGAAMFIQLKVAFGSLWLGKIAGAFYFGMVFAYILDFLDIARVFMYFSIVLFSIVLIVYPLKFFPVLKSRVFQKGGSEVGDQVLPF